MIVCSCNVISEKDIIDAARAIVAEGSEPTPARAYRCLNCASRCGRCVPTVRKILEGIEGVGTFDPCAVCPARIES